MLVYANVRFSHEPIVRNDENRYYTHTFNFENQKDFDIACGLNNAANGLIEESNKY